MHRILGTTAFIVSFFPPSYAGLTMDGLVAHLAFGEGSGPISADLTEIHENHLAGDAVVLPTTHLATSPSRHYISYRNKPLLLVGDSGTQVVMQNTNVDYRQWIDDCAARGIRAVHIWSFTAPRQKQDGSVIEDRYGYVYPGITPWARKSSGPDATDQLKQWDLRSFDEGAKGDPTHYWPRLRDLCGYAEKKGLVIGITVFFGWPKHDSSKRPDWSYHPFNTANGGHLTDNDAVQMIASPGTEVWDQPWSEGWPSALKTQWVWERFCKKLIEDLKPFGNVFFAFMDEHSYGEGNCGDHFLRFFKTRGAVWVDWAARRSAVDWVMSDTFGGSDRNKNAVSGFRGKPARPYLNLEGPPYQGDDVRFAIWTFSVGGGHYFFHNDERQETVTTGIMGYDPGVPRGDKGQIRRDWLGHASRFFNEHVSNLDALTPRNDLSGAGTYCLADAGREYIVYSKTGAATTFELDLRGTEGTFMCRFYDPRTGRVSESFKRAGGKRESYDKPNSDDWVLHVALESKGSALTPDKP